MDPISFLGTVYLGDRTCTTLVLDGNLGEIRLGVDLISRVRGSGWDFYSAEDVKNGSLVFEGIREFQFASQGGRLPNAWIEIVKATSIDKELTEIVISLGHVDKDAVSTELLLTVVCRTVAIETEVADRIRT